MQAYINTHKDMGVKQCSVSFTGMSNTRLKKTEARIHEELDFPVQTTLIILGNNVGMIEVKFGFYGTTNKLQWALEKVIRDLLSYSRGSTAVDIHTRDVTNCYDMMLRVWEDGIKGVASREMFDNNLSYKIPLNLRPLSASPSSGDALIYVKEQEGINPKVIEYEY